MPKLQASPRQTIATPSARRSFQRRLLVWYDLQKRDLPWRADRDPYRVWLSEIMLQQTRVNAVLDHYRRFLKRFPDLRTLAAAREPSVLAAWSGLGYYRRARMMHAAAKQVVKEYNGRFPSTSTELRTLPGIGRYTAAAIASIAFDEPAAVVDGNVQRVLDRLLGRNLSENEVWDRAQQLLTRARPGDSNQALMELGATVCTPRQPNCSLCPVRDFCATQGEAPRRLTAPSQRKLNLHCLIDLSQRGLLLVQRSKDASLMAGMWELPEVAGSALPIEFRVRHSITVTDYSVSVSVGSVPPGIAGKRFPPSRFASLPLTGLTRKILKRAALWPS